MAELSVTLSAYGLIFVPIVVSGVDSVAMVDTGSFARVQTSRRLTPGLALETRADGDASAEGYAFGESALERGPPRSLSDPWSEAASEVTIVRTTLEKVSEQLKTPFDVLLG